MTDMVNCKTCFAEINDKASKCPVCLSDQSDVIRRLKKISKTAGFMGAIISFVIALYPFYPVIDRAWFPNPSIEVFSIDTKLKDKSLSKISLLNDGNEDIFINRIEFKSYESDYSTIRSQNVEFNDWIKTGGIAVKRFGRPRSDPTSWSYLTISGYEKRIALVDENNRNAYAKSCFQLKVYDKEFSGSPLPGVIDLIPVRATTYFSNTRARKVEKLNSNHEFWSLIGFYESKKCKPEYFNARANRVARGT